MKKWLGSLAKLVGRVTSSIVQSGAKYWWSSSRISGVFGGAPAAGLDVTHDSAMTVATVYACTQARAETLASLPPMVYLEVAGGARRRDKSSPLWGLLHDSPNPEMDSMTFYELLHMRTVNRGNGFAEIERDNQDRPIALWPIHNSRVEAYREPDGSLAYRISTDHLDERTREYRFYTIPDRNMLNVPAFGSDGIIGCGVIPYAVEEISASMAMTQYSASWFKRGAHPSAVVEHPAYIDDDDMRAEFRKDINTNHAGRENWHEVPVMWQGAKWKQIQFSPEQSQLITGRQYSDKTICRFYKVPPAIVQIFDDYKFSSVDAMIQQFVMTCLRADAVRLERAIARKVMRTRDGRGRLVELFDDPYIFEFVLEALLRGDAKKQAETLEIERRNGIINADEWRGLSNREPLPDRQGEIYTVVGGFENLATLGSTYPRGNRTAAAGGAGTEDRNSNPQSSQQPAFDKPRFMQALENGIPKHRDRSPGGSVADATTFRDEMDKAALEVLQEAVQRVESIAQKEMDRAAEMPSDQRQERLAAMWPKHAQRLESAILPAAKLYCRYRDAITPEQLASSVASEVVDKQVLLGPVADLSIFEAVTPDEEESQ